MQYCIASIHGIRSKIHTDPLPGLSYWVFHRPEWISVGYKKVLQMYEDYILLKSLLKTEHILIKELELKIDW